MLRETDYPAVELPLKTGDRFLLYTDGLTESENASGEQFGSKRITDVLRQSNSSSPTDLSASLFRESSAWQPAPPNKTMSR